MAPGSELDTHDVDGDLQEFFRACRAELTKYINEGKVFGKDITERS
jgi:hypothetical protein